MLYNNTDGTVEWSTGPTGPTAYIVNLTPGASAGLFSNECSGGAGLGGAIVIGTYRKSSGFNINPYPTDANLSSYALSFSSRASS